MAENDDLTRCDTLEKVRIQIISFIPSIIGWGEKQYLVERMLKLTLKCDAATYATYFLMISQCPRNIEK